MSNLLIQPRVDVEIPDPLMRRLIEFSEMSAVAKIGLQCLVCKQAVVGGNHGLYDEHLTMSCACRQFTGVNPIALLKKREVERQTAALKDGSADLPLS